MPDTLQSEPDLGEHRRALLADLVSGLPGELPVRGRGRLARRPGALATVGEPQSDAELRDRLQHRVGRMVSHPRAIRVDVEGGVVRLSGRVLAKEREGLLAQVERMPGVQKLVNAMTAHDFPSEIAGH